MIEIVIVGDGGHSKVVQEVIAALKEYKIIAVLDDKYSSAQKKGCLLYGPLSLSHTVIKRGNRKVFVAIGDNRTRLRIVERLGLSNDQYVSLVHPSSIVSCSATIGVGTVVMPNCVIQPHAKIGNHSIINTGSIIEHDSIIEDYVHISPNATLTGNVIVRQGSHVGAGATVIPGKEVGEWSIVGAGATVIRNVPSRQTVVGSPARVL